ncbi:MAG: hypothetical protein WA988_13480, partial [Candidatus Nanopelagicales bacterium]
PNKAPDKSLASKVLDRVQSASASANAGVVNDDKGVGLKGSLDDVRVDLGSKKIALGVYGSADGTIQLLVTPTDDGGCTITLTRVVRGKAGGFLGKRDSAEPVTSGYDWNLGAARYAEASQTVTKSRTLSKNEAAKTLSDLDALATSNVKGKRTFGVAAAARAYTSVFGGKLSDLGEGGEANKAGDTVSKISETGGGFEAKAGGSGGSDANSRTGVGINGGSEDMEISGYSESATEKDITRSIVFGRRTGTSIGANVSEGAAGGSVGVSQSTQDTRTYVFTVPKEKPELLKQVRALKDEAAAKAFVADHPDLAASVKGKLKTNGLTVGANVGPLSVKIGTTSTEDSNVTAGRHTVIGPDGKSVEKKYLQGTEEGSRKDDASLNALGVKLAQGNTTATSRGSVEKDGQSALDVTQTTSKGLPGTGAISKNATAMGKADVAATLATGGPMGLVKKLAERVGEPSTVGAHFDDDAFNQLVDVAKHNQKRWNDSILVAYRSEWFALRNQLIAPEPPQEWLDQDESGREHFAAKQLMRMKSIAQFIAISGADGQQAIAHVRGEYGPNAIGETVSWPPSLQDQKAVYADLATQVEHLRATLLGFAKAGDAAGGKQLLDDLSTKLRGLRQKIQDAPDHVDPTLGLRAANGIGDMQQTVTSWRVKFDNAIEAQSKGAPIDATLYGPNILESTVLDQKEKGDDQDALDAAHAKTVSLEQAGPTRAFGKRATEKAWADYDKRHAVAIASEQKAADQQQDDHAAQVAARADEVKTQAEASIGEFEQRCLAAKGRAFGLLDSAVGAAPAHFYSNDSTTDNLLMQLGTLMREWLQEWNQLADFYKDAGRPAGTRTDLKPGLSNSKLNEVYNNSNMRDYVKVYCGELRQQWGRDL